MGQLGEWIADAYAALASVPFVVFAAVWFGVYGLTRDKKKSTANAMDVTTVFLIGIVAALLDYVARLRFGGIWFLLLLFLLTAGLIGNAQYRLKGRIDTRRLVRAVWRLGFLALSAAYVVLMVIGIAQSVASL